VAFAFEALENLCKLALLAKRKALNASFEIEHNIK
jgi:hypothetical protein